MKKILAYLYIHTTKGTPHIEPSYFISEFWCNKCSQWHRI